MYISIKILLKMENKNTRKIKTKYGGNELKFVSLIASHNSRIQCFIDKFIKTDKQVRFKNCAVLRMELKPVNAIEINLNIVMVHEGELEVKEQQKNKLYYTTPSSPQLGGDETDDCKKTNTCPLFPKKLFPKNLFKKKEKQKGIQEVEFNEISMVLNEQTLQNLLNVKPTDLDRKNVFYIVRHGQAEHNIYPKFQVIRKKDTSLTDIIGNNQAVNAGRALAGLLKFYNDNTIDYIFCSDLLRTRQTILNICKGIYLTDKDINLPSKMVVLPCANELSYFKNSNCDFKTASDAGAKFAAENFPKCNMNEIENSSSPCIQIKDDETGLTISVDWSFYTPFYGNAFRNTIGKNQTMHCRDTTMVAMALKYISGDISTGINDFINERKSENVGGKSRRRRKTRKKTQSKTKKRMKII